ncbi:hypothetical protein M8994_20840, partial [Brucella sp. 21LCYQ03]|nr:hypothetical protein [Brucella sp. 21LCYQ03]
MQDRHKQSVKFDTSLDFARKKDQGDELRDARDRFFIQPNEIYMDGNSLGMASKDAEAALLNVLALWKKDGIKIWNREDGKYYHYARVLAKPMAKLINADANEVTLVGSTTSNIHQAISTFYHPTKSRYKILVDDLNFPTERYAVNSQVALKGYNPQEAVRV